MSKIKLAIAEDYKPFRHRIVEVLNQEVDFEVVLQADNGKELLENLETMQPDIVLMDIRMPVMDGIEATDKIRRAYPQIKIIAFSQYDDEGNIIEMNIHGVKSFIGKNDDIEELLKAIRIVYIGGAYMTEHAARIVQNHLRSVALQAENEVTLPEIEHLTKLSDLELEILWHVSCHKSMKEIATIFSVSPNTINNREAGLRKKLNLNGKGKLLEYALSIKRHLRQLNGFKKEK
jgi:DNA-binding NarL/FixJ family response regulator